MNKPTKVIVDCELGGLPDPAVAERFEEAALSALRAGDLEKAAQLMEEAKAILHQSSLASEVIVEMTDEEIALHEAAKTDALVGAKVERQAEVKGALALTDRWPARAFEDGVPMHAAQSAHRQALRATFAEINLAPDLAALAQISIPAAPE